MVTTGGAIEEDLMKVFRPHYMGDFKLSGRALRKQVRTELFMDVCGLCVCIVRLLCVCCVLCVCVVVRGIHISISSLPYLSHMHTNTSLTKGLNRIDTHIIHHTSYITHHTS